MRTSIKKRLSIILAVMMLVSLFSFTSAFAATESGSADFSVVIFGNTVYGPVAVDDSQSVLDVVLDQQTPGNYTVDASGSYVYSVTIGGNTYAAQNDSYQYNPDGSGWSYDFGWVFTVNGDMPEFYPGYYMALDEYDIQDGDDVKFIYAYVYTEWNSYYDTTITIIY